MILIGLTGSIGMGKSTTAEIFRNAGLHVHDSDAAVHSLYAGEAVPAIAAEFPSCIGENGVDRAALSKIVLHDARALRRLEEIVHPLVAAHRQSFIGKCQVAGERMVVLDVPLLFETGLDQCVDVIVVASAPFDVQRARVLQRPGMTEQRFRDILDKQLPDSEKRLRAHYVVDTGNGIEHAAKQVSDLIRAIA